MIIKVRVIPYSKKTEIISRVASVVRVRVAAPTFDGKANEILLNFLSEFFEVPRSKIFLRKGKGAREKTIEIEGKSEEKLKEILETIP